MARIDYTDEQLLTFTMIVEVADCTKCGAMAGEQCCTPKLNYNVRPHVVRARAAGMEKEYNSIKEATCAQHQS